MAGTGVVRHPENIIADKFCKFCKRLGIHCLHGTPIIPSHQDHGSSTHQLAHDEVACYNTLPMNSHEQDMPSARFLYRGAIEVLNSLPAIKAHHVRRLLELEQAVQQEYPTEDVTRPRSLLSLALNLWDHERIYAFQYVFNKALAARNEEDDEKYIRLTKFWLRCSDAILDIPLFPENPEYYDEVVHMLNERWERRPLFYDTLLTAVAYNYRLFGDDPDEEQANSLRQTYHQMRNLLFRMKTE